MVSRRKSTWRSASPSCFAALDVHQLGRLASFLLLEVLDQHGPRPVEREIVVNRLLGKTPERSGGCRHGCAFAPLGERNYGTAFLSFHCNPFKLIFAPATEWGIGSGGKPIPHSGRYTTRNYYLAELLVWFGEFASATRFCESVGWARS
jgi:hypothetical protein